MHEHLLINTPKHILSAQLRGDSSHDMLFIFTQTEPISRGRQNRFHYHWLRQILFDKCHCFLRRTYKFLFDTTDAVSFDFLLHKLLVPTVVAKVEVVALREL